ncbi:MAG: hypothetical protein ACKV2T_35305 [Kofleriaceae bacterium]
MKVLLLAVLVVACGKSESRAPPADPPSTPAKNGSAKDGTGMSRTEWVALADRLAAASGPIPRAKLDELVAAQTWKNVDAKSFEEVLSFMPTAKRLYMAIGERGSIDDLVALAVYTLDVDVATIRAGVAVVATFAADDTTRPVRERGLEKLRLGTAIDMCALLHVVSRATAPVRDTAFTRLAEPAIYRELSRVPLQLILATLDEKILPTVDPAIRTRYQTIREVVAAAHAARTEATETIYQGAEPPSFEPRTVVIVSKTGGFTITMGPVTGGAPLAKRDGDDHVIAMTTIDGTLFEARCSDDLDVKETAAQIAAVEGTTRRADNVYVLKRPKHAGLVRVESVGGKGCLISVEGPQDKFPMALAEMFVSSLRAAT